MSETLDPQIELEIESMNASLAEDAIIADLESDNLILRLYQPGGVPEPGDPFFDTDLPGGLTAAQKDLIVRAIQDTLIAKATAASLDTINPILQAEVSARQLADSILTATVSSESATRQTNEESVAIQIDTVGSRIDANVAAIQEERAARSTATDAIALQVEQVVAVTAANTTAINETKIAYADADTAIGARIDVVVADVGQNTASIVEEQQARADADSAMATRIDQVQSSMDTANATISSIQTTLTSSNQSNASSLLSLSTTLNGHTASINTQQTSINGILAKYSVTLDVNGYVTGYSLINNGSSGTMRVRSDRFIVGFPGYSDQQAFVVQNVNGVATMSVNSAIIGDAAINTLKLAGNSVTVPVYASGYGNSGAVWFGAVSGTIASVQATFPDTCSIAVVFYWQGICSPDDSTDSRIQLMVDGNVVMDVGNSLQQGFIQPFTATTNVTVSKGTHTFSFRCANQYVRGYWSLANWSMVLLGVMR